jgi:hypothetical protein
MTYVIPPPRQEIIKSKDLHIFISFDTMENSPVKHIEMNL